MTLRGTMRGLKWCAVGLMVAWLLFQPRLWNESEARAAYGPCSLTSQTQNDTRTCSGGACQGTVVVTLAHYVCANTNTEIPCTNNPATNGVATYQVVPYDKGTSAWLACLAKYQKSCYTCVVAHGLTGALPSSSSAAASIVSKICGGLPCTVDYCCYTDCLRNLSTPAYSNGTTCQ